MQFTLAVKTAYSSGTHVLGAAFTLSLMDDAYEDGGLCRKASLIGLLNGVFTSIFTLVGSQA